MRVKRGGGRCGRGEHPARRCEGRAWRRPAWLDHRNGGCCRAERDRPRPIGDGGGLHRGGGERPGPGDPDKPRRRSATSEYPVLGACQQVEHLNLSALGLSLKNLCPTAAGECAPSTVAAKKGPITLSGNKSPLFC